MAIFELYSFAVLYAHVTYQVLHTNIRSLRGPAVGVGPLFFSTKFLFRLLGSTLVPVYQPEASILQLLQPVASGAWPRTQASSVEVVRSPGGKRKIVHRPFGVEGTEYGKSKKLKPGTEESRSPHLPHDKSHLPSEICHHAFTFVSTRGLGVLLQVNKVFNEYLDPRSLVKSSASPSKYSNYVKPLEPDAIWQLSRSQQRYGYLDSCRLGPGFDGLATMFIFGVTCWGICLLKDTLKKIDLLLASTIPSLIPALAHVYATIELQVLPFSALENVAVHDRPETTKLYSILSIESANKKLSAAQDIGAAAVEEWLKVLDTRGKELRSDASRWERWTIADGLAPINQPLHPRSIFEPKDSAQQLQYEVPSCSQLPSPIRSAAKISHNQYYAFPGTPVGLANEFIRNSWGKGRKVNKRNSTQLAANVLLSVPSRFHADVAQDDEAIITAGQPPVIDPPEGSLTQKLTSENIK
ncbi:uncharacterized protein LY79DRAFT_574381 [Colletotrichum navitas]|uniref:Uncharacterized protein n=1 Tax=Colletotrichum navitas TaxID=681940 RepID=A0AAD8QDC9_9PEZI|nr:uncharacterized protein LY79DRAFT_574381 [Colletotrichum navitas]KAK1599936.1 hypothetical protein LY79DRAFT_574381 [Colletotrichum navitas]